MGPWCGVLRLVVGLGVGGMVVAQGGQAPPPVAQAPVAQYDKAIFLNPIPGGALSFLNQFAGAPAKDVWHDKQFRKLMKDGITSCEFHYGRDMPLWDAMQIVLEESHEPVQIREGRYVLMPGGKGPYLGGRGFLWIDMQDGIVLGGFYFHPTNGEPTPSMNLFSRQVKEDVLSMGQLPPEFARDLAAWMQDARIYPVTTRYFLNGLNKKIVLQHDEDFCSPVDGTVAPPGDACQQMIADVADLDMDAAYYLEQTHHATNSTAWMITGADQVAWLQVRANACGIGPDPLGCRIRMTRERTVGIIRHSPAPMPHPGRR